MPELRECLNTRQAAEYLGLSDIVLRVWRTEKRGPKYSKAGSRVIYRLSALNEWLDSNAVQPKQ